MALIGGDLHRSQSSSEDQARWNRRWRRLGSRAGSLRRRGSGEHAEIVAHSSSRTRLASSTISTAGPTWRGDRPRSMAGRSPGKSPPTWQHDVLLSASPRLLLNATRQNGSFQI